MTSEEKMKRIKNMIGKKLALSQYYNLLEEMDDIKYDYNDYMITGPIKVEEELIFYQSYFLYVSFFLLKSYFHSL